MNRRVFLVRLEGASAAVVAGALGAPLSGCIGFHYVNSSLVGNRVRIERREFDRGRFALVDVPRFHMPIYVYRHDDDRFTAVSTECMHRGCPVEPVAGHLVCPCHGSEYANDGAVLKGPTRLPLRQFPTRAEGPFVIVELPAETSSQ